MSTSKLGADDKMLFTKTVQPGPLQDIWDTNKWIDHEKTTALVHLIQPDKKVIVPYGWIRTMYREKYWTRNKQYECYYTENPEGPRYDYRVPKSRRFHRNTLHLYTVHVLELYCKCLSELHYYIYFMPTDEFKIGPKIIIFSPYMLWRFCLKGFCCSVI